VSTKKEELQKNEKRIEKSYWQTKKKYLESLYYNILAFQRARHYDLMCTKTRTLGWNENYGIQESGIEDSKGKIII